MIFDSLFVPGPRGVGGDENSIDERCKCGRMNRESDFFKGPVRGSESISPNFLLFLALFLDERAS